MKIYTVQRMDKYDYDFSVELRKCGCFTDKEKAKEKAKSVYKKMCGEYEDDMLEYSDTDMYEDPDEGALDVEEDDENGYYKISFGYQEHYEMHNVAIDEWDLKLSDIEEYDVFRKCKREYLIEDIKEKAEEMECDLAGVDMERLADRAEKTLDNNDSMYESYWMSIEYAIEETTQN